MECKNALNTIGKTNDGGVGALQKRGGDGGAVGSDELPVAEREEVGVLGKI